MTKVLIRPNANVHSNKDQSFTKTSEVKKNNYQNFTVFSETINIVGIYRTNKQDLYLAMHTFRTISATSIMKVN